MMVKLNPDKVFVVGHAYRYHGKTFIIKAKNKCKYWGDPDAAIDMCTEKTAPCRGYDFGPDEYGCGINIDKLMSGHDKENCPKCKEE